MEYNGEDIQDAIKYMAAELERTINKVMVGRPFPFHSGHFPPGGADSSAPEDSSKELTPNVLGEDMYPYFYEEDTTELELPNIKKCECGSEVANVPYHSDWCPKSESSKP